MDIIKEEEIKEVNEKDENELKEIQLTDFQVFKNEMFKHLQILEDKINQKISEKAISTENNFTELSEKVNSLIEKSNNLSDLFSNIKFRQEKIFELEAFKKKSESQLLTHDIQLNEAIKDISNLRFKYDKIFIDNLTLPGFIGATAQYKNLSQFLSYLIQELSSINYTKEQTKREMKEIKQKSENTIKEVTTLVNNSQTICNSYSDTKNNILEEKIQSEIKLLNEKLMDLRIENVKSSMNLEKKTNELMNEWEKIINIKAEIEDKLNNNINYFKKDVDTAVKRYNDIINEFYKLKTKIGNQRDINQKKRPTVQIRSDQINAFKKKLNLNSKGNKIVDVEKDMDFTDDEGDNQKKEKVKKLVRQITNKFNDKKKEINKNNINNQKI